MIPDIEYPYMPPGRHLKYVPADHPFMLEAKKAQETLSTELGQSTGAVVVLNEKIIGVGANQAGIKNRRIQKKHREGICLRRLLKIPTGTKYWVCPGCAGYSSHAEQQAIRQAEKNGHDPRGADLYLYGHWWACEPCWNAAIQAGIKDIYVADDAHKNFVRKV